MQEIEAVGADEVADAVDVGDVVEGLPSTESRTGLQALCDMGQTRLAMETNGEASHSPQPTYGPACSRTSSRSWLPSPMSSTSGIAR